MRPTDVIVHMAGSLSDTIGTLSDADGTAIATSGTGFFAPSERHFLIREKLQAGIYHIEMKARFNGSSKTKDQGVYVLNVDSVVEPGSTSADAAMLEMADIRGGNISSSTDVDYFRVDTAKSTPVLIRAVSSTVDIDGALLDSNLSPVVTDIYEETFSKSEKLHGFTIRHTLPVGTHYIKLSSSGGDATGPYTIKIIDPADIPAKDSNYKNILRRCKNTNAAIEDPLYGCQWNLKDIGHFSGMTNPEDINVEEVWSTNKGEGIGVAVVDSDFDAVHEDLRENADASMSHSYVSSGLLSPGHSHGTKVAGIIAARDNHRGVRGVAPRATVYGYNYLQNSTIGNLVDAMTRNMDETAVSNNSWGSSNVYGFNAVSSLWERAVAKGATEGFGGKGVFYSFAAGNGGWQYHNANHSELGNYYAVTAVCAVNAEGKKSKYSESGASLWVCGPSNDPTNQTIPDIGIVSTNIYDKYAQGFGGTSAASPAVAGTAALIRSANPSLTWRDVKLILAASARKNHSSNTGWETGALKYGSKTDRYHFNHDYGFGVVNAKAAVDLAKTWEPLPLFISETQTSTDTDINVPDTNTAVTSSVTIGSDVQFTEFVELNMTFGPFNRYPRVKNLDIELVSPSGKVSVISPHCPSPRDFGCWLYFITGPYRFGSSKHLDG